MAFEIQEGLLDELRSRVSLASICAEDLEWDDRKSNPAKGDLWAPCPFHREKSASFHVDDRKSFYYCFGCHAKGDVITYVREMKNVNFHEAVLLLANKAGVHVNLNPPSPTSPDFNDLVDIKNFIVLHFTQEHFLELGIKTGWSDFINAHPRLLRSLSWGDDDYAGCVMELISKMNARNDGSIEVLKAYLDQRFSEEKVAAVSAIAFEGSKRHLGYQYEAPRNDIISVMMPFSPSFSEVYGAIKTAAASTNLQVKRADEVWDESVLIQDILKLINHSAVVICDLTGRNENVFYELGIAHAWGKPVIPITQNADDVPFDLKHHRYLSYLNNSEGRDVLSDKLSGRLKTLIAPNPLL